MYIIHNDHYLIENDIFYHLLEFYMMIHSMIDNDLNIFVNIDYQY